MYQKKLQKELEQDQLLYGKESEKFVTSGYKKQLELNKIHEEEMKKKEAEEQAHMAKKAGMNAFRLNLLDGKNVAFGGGTATVPKKEENQGQKRLRPEGDDEDDAERERERKKRLKERAERDNERAEEIRLQREAERQQKLEELQKQYAQHSVTENEKQEALERFKQRQLAKKAKAAATST